MSNILGELLIQFPFHITRETFQENYHGGTNLSVYINRIVTFPYTVTTNINKVMVFLLVRSLAATFHNEYSMNFPATIKKILNLGLRIKLH